MGGSKERSCSGTLGDWAEVQTHRPGFQAFGKPLKSPNRKGGTSSFLKFSFRIQVR